MKPLKPCKHPGCRKLSQTGYCEEHQKVVEKNYRNRQDEKRGTATERGYTWNWHKVRNMKLSENPLCERCEKNGKITIAVLVHHRDRNPRNNLEDNLESLCGMCHQEEHKV
jgi:5-methylcytosine-specific restriction protein A